MIKLKRPFFKVGFSAGIILDIIRIPWNYELFITDETYHKGLSG